MFTAIRRVRRREIHISHGVLLAVSSRSFALF